jgi:transposase
MDRRSGNEIFGKAYRIQFATFVGVDLHKCTVSLAAVDGDGESVRHLKCSTKCVEKIEAWLTALPGPVWMAVEAVGFVEWFTDRFRDCVVRCDIADAAGLKCLRGKRRKTDRNDALDIALRLSGGDCPLGWSAPPELMRLRKLGRHWRRLSRTLSRAKHGLSSILLAANIAGPKLDGAAAQRWILAHGHLLKDADRDSFMDLVDVIQLLERQRESLKRKIIFANRDERFIDDVELLKTVPGIDEIWGCIIAAEVGPFDRFPNADALEYWAGLTPDNQESAGRSVSGHITKAGSATLRWALAKAGLTLCHSDAKAEEKRQRLIARRGKAIANTAMARRLLKILYAMMRERKPYVIGEKRDRTKAANKARMEKRAKEACMA